MTAEIAPEETYRAAVGAWECDAFGHLNIAFYGERFADAAAALFDRVVPGTPWRLDQLDIRYVRELRAGEVMSIRSHVLARDGAQIRIAHRASGAAGDVTTLAEHALVTDDPHAASAAVPGADVAWEPFAPIDLPQSDGVYVACRNRVRAGETDGGGLSLLGYLHRFSDACLSVIESIGMTEAYRRDADRGFATVETRLLVTGEIVPAGAGVIVTSSVLGIGASSLRMVHRLRDARGGRLLAQFYQAGVNFDLAARRSAPWPQEFRARADALRLKTT